MLPEALSEAPWLRQIICLNRRSDSRCSVLACVHNQVQRKRQYGQRGDVEVHALIAAEETLRSV